VDPIDPADEREWEIHRAFEKKDKEISALRDSLAAANARAKEAERKLCAAKEQLKVACKWLAGCEWGTIEFERAMHEINAIEASPCRHEAEADALREAIDEAERAYPTDIFSEPGPDDFYHLRTGPRGISERLHGSWARHLVKVIRDNAARAGGEGRVE